MCSRETYFSVFSNWKVEELKPKYGTSPINGDGKYDLRSLSGPLHWRLPPSESRNFLLGWIGAISGIEALSINSSLTYIADNSAALQKNIFSINSSLDIMLHLHLRDIRYLNSDHG
jgi:hypothetical protein